MSCWFSGWKNDPIKILPMGNSLWVTSLRVLKSCSMYFTHRMWANIEDFCGRQSNHIFSCDQQGVSDIAHFVNGSLITSFLMTNSMWVTLHILWKVVSSHLCLSPIGGGWHCTFHEMQSNLIFSYHQQRVSDIAHFVKGSLITSVPMYDQQYVSDIAHFVKGSPITSFPMPTNSKWVTLHILWKAVWSHLFIWPTASEQHSTFCERQSDHISYDQQFVSDIACFVVKGSLITSFSMTNSLWVTLQVLWQAVSLHLSYDQQFVSDIAHFVKGSLTFISFPMTNRKWALTLHICERQSHHIFSCDQWGWVTLHILWKAIWSRLFLSPTACEWHCTAFGERQSDHIFSYGQQRVSDIAHFVEGSLIILSFPMANSEWVTLHCILWKAITSFPMTNRWVTLDICERQSHHIFPMTNSKWVTLCILWKAVSSHIANREWVTLHILWKAAPLHIFSYHQQQVSDISHFVKGGLITSFPMTNSMWVTFHILWKVVWSHLFLWPTVCEWHCIFCERQSDHTFSYDHWQGVSDIAHFVKAVWLHLLLWPPGCE